jgi:hypothetical protein
MYSIETFCLDNALTGLSFMADAHGIARCTMLSTLPTLGQVSSLV